MPNESPKGLPTRLPGADHAIVPKEKVCDYLLSMNHPIGRFKAVFFRALGYTTGEWQRLQTDLLNLAQSGEAVPGQKSSYGQKWEVRGSLVGPSGRRADVVTVWIVLQDETSPQLITAFPGEHRELQRT